MTSLPGSASTPAPTYDRLVLAALRVSLAVLVAKVLSIIVLARFAGVRTEFDRVWFLLPRISFETDPATVASITTLSTLAMGLAALGIAVWTWWRPYGSTQAAVGRGVACVVTLQTLGLEVYRHQRGADTLAWQYAGLVLVSGVCGIALLSVRLWNDHRRRTGWKERP